MTDLMGLIMGRGCMLGMNPIGMGYFLSVYAQEPGRPLLALSILLGMSSVMEPADVVKYGLSMLVTAVVLHLAEHTGKYLTKEMKYAVGGGIGAVMALSGGMFTIYYKTYIILAILEGMLIFIFARLFQDGIGYILYHKKREALCGEELISMGLLLGTAVYGMMDMELRLPGKAEILTGIACALGLIAGALLASGRKKERGKEEDKEQYVRQNIQLLTKNKVQEFSDSLQRLSASFTKMTKEHKKVSYAGVNEIFEDISGRFCKDCSQCRHCWGEEYEFTYAAAQNIFQAARRQGYVGAEDVPADFSSQCIYAAEFVEETNDLLQQYKETFDFESRLAESREAVAGQLSEMARMMKNFASELYEMKEVRTKQEEEMIKRLKKSHIAVQKLVIMERREKRKEIHLMARMRTGRCVTAREIAVMLGQVMGKRLIPAKQTKSVLGRELEVMVFMEDTPYKTLTGVARATKDGEEVSGDNFSILSLDSGEEILMLSDGMGAGEAANQESCLVIELLEHFLEAGFDKEAAVRMINSTYVLQSDSSSFSTIDLGSIDLYTGEAEFVKLGSAASFIKHKDGVECISAETLPAGMFEQIELVRQKRKLSDGEYVVMVTDGILDCFEGENKEAQVAFLLEESECLNPREIASYLLNEALKRSGNKNQDDMTVLAAGFWEKA